MDASKSAAAEWRGFWFLPFAAALGYATSVIHVYSIGPFFAPLEEAFGWSRAQTSAGLTVTALLGAVFCIPAGMLMDRIGPRRLALAGIVLMAGSFALLSTATGSMINWLLLWGVIAIGTFGVQATVWTGAVASRFEKARGLAFAITLSGASIAAALYPVLAATLITEQGWRAAFAWMGLGWLVLMFPLIFLFFRGAHDVRKAEAEAAKPALAGMSLQEGLRTPALYKLLLAGALFAFSCISVVVHFVPILTDRGAEPLAAAGVAALVGIFSIIGRLGTGLLLDRFPGHWVGAAAFVIPIFACALLLADGANPISQALAAAIFGLTVGSEVDVIAYLAARHFGLKNYGALYGALTAALGLGMAFGPLVAGLMFDAYESYAPFLILTAALTAVAAVALITLGAPKPLAEAPPAKT